MDKFQVISSAKNPRIKNLENLLQKSRERRKQGLFVIEGRKECALALASGIALDSFYFYEDGLIEDEKDLLIQLEQLNVPGFRLEKSAFEKIAYRESTLGLILVGREFKRDLEDFRNLKNPLFLVVEGVEKPGNLGAILRTADAAGLDGLLFCDAKTDLFNPNVIRASLGCVFTVPWVQCSNEEAITFLKENNCRILASDLEGAVPYHTESYNQATAIVMGTEATGITPLWREAADACIKIPMLGEIDSLNVSTATAILVYEAMRQRGFPNIHLKP